ncbi:MAG: hypothetical protein BRD23_08510 [Halobacteriales archaeon SW_9_67_25]|nr:MAG: hypothetical protein BRD23_08510 [Halobacteriales archaeon SW_9_67_25]
MTRRRGFLLSGCEVTVVSPAGGGAVDVRQAARRAVTDPHGPPLAERVAPDDDVALVVTDVTRATPDGVLLDVLLSELAAAGLDREQVAVVVGLGLHRPMTDAELREALGGHADLAVNHDPDATVPVGTVEGCRIDLFEAVAAADAVLSTGMVEPMLAREGVRLGRINDNPFRAFVDQAGDLAGLDFCLSVTHGPAGILDASAGDPRAVVADLAATAREALSVEVAEGYDAVLGGVGAPKDANLYQATRAATYLVLGAHNPLRQGGRVVIPARLPEGAGEGTGERRFHEWLSTAESARILYEEMRDGYEPGAQRAFVVARALLDHDVWVTNSQHPEVVEECLMHAAPAIEDAVEPGSDVLVVPDALNTLLV